MAAAKLLTPRVRSVTQVPRARVGYKHRRDHEVRGFEDDPDSGEPSAMGRGAPEGRLVGRRLFLARSRGQVRASRNGARDGCGRVGDRADKARPPSLDRLKDATAAAAPIGRLIGMVGSDGAPSAFVRSA